MRRTYNAEATMRQRSIGSFKLANLEILVGEDIVGKLNNAMLERVK